MPLQFNSFKHDEKNNASVSFQNVYLKIRWECTFKMLMCAKHIKSQCSTYGTNFFFFLNKKYYVGILFRS